jgi:hypothetical protein
MSINTFVGLSFAISGAFLQEFALYRRTIARTQRKCNDSKATLLLYFSTGLSCELTSLFLLPFHSYLIVGISYPATFHILFFTYFAYKIPPTGPYKLSFLLFLVSFL